MSKWIGPGGNYIEIGVGEPAELDGTYITEQRMTGQNLVTVRRWFRETVDLPTAPGFYLVDDPEYGTGPIVIELLGDGKQWVDCSDRNYLSIAEVEELAPLHELRTEKGWRKKNGMDS